MPSGFLDHPWPLAFAHRGGASHFPENSWKAFEHAVRLGYDYLETDAHATADGTVVAFHDKTLDRVTDGIGKIAELTAAQVAAARIDGTEPIPLLADLLTAWPAVRFNIDIKNAPAIAPLIEVLRVTNCWDRVCLTSFSGRRLDAARRLLPRPVCTATTPAGIGAITAGLPANDARCPIRRRGRSGARRFRSRWRPRDSSPARTLPDFRCTPGRSTTCGHGEPAGPRRRRHHD